MVIFHHFYTYDYLNVYSGLSRGQRASISRDQNLSSVLKRKTGGNSLGVVVAVDSNTRFRIWGPFLESPGNLPGWISILFLKWFFAFADYTVITDVALGQCFLRIIRC